MIGIKTDQGPTGALVFTSRFAVVGVLVAIAFAGRLVFALVRGRMRAPLGGLAVSPSAERSRLAPRRTQRPLF